MSKLKMPDQCEFCIYELIGEPCDVRDAWLLNKEHEEIEDGKCKQFIDDREEPIISKSQQKRIRVQIEAKKKEKL